MLLTFGNGGSKILGSNSLTQHDSAWISGFITKLNEGTFNSETIGNPPI